MRLIVLFLAAFAVSAEAPPPELQRFDEAIGQSRLKDAAAVIDRLIEQRTPADGQPRQDALINSLLGRLYLAVHQEAAAKVYLARAPLDALPASSRTATALAYGQALELRGERAAALHAYRDAADNGATPSERRSAQLGIARQLLITSPREVEQQVRGIATGSSGPDRWEARYLLALSSSLLGDQASAARFADEAWADATSAPPSDLAPLHVGTLRAGLAAARRDRDAERAMLIATNGLALTATGALSSQLPVCGDDGLKPSDFVTFGLIAGPYHTRHLVPIAATRPEVVAPFYDRLAASALIKQTDGTSAVGTIVTVACRAVVHPEFVANPRVDDPLIDWFSERGIYPATATNDASDQHVNAIAARVDSLESRFGKDSILLIAPRWQLMTVLEARAGAGDPVPQLGDLRLRIVDGLKRAGAPDWLAMPINSRAEYEQLARTASSASLRLSAAQEFYRKELLTLPFELTRSLVAGFLDNPDEQLPAGIPQLVLDLNARAPKSLSGRDRQGWLLTVARMQRLVGTDDGARVTIASAGLEKDLCTASDALPKLLEQHFSYNDYPEELIAGEQEGSVLFEFNLAATGTVTSPRVVYSLPSGLFDDASKKGIAALRYVAPTRGRKPAACRGLFQPVVWRLEKDNKVWLPTLTPAAHDETT
jgi:TonB family protein